MIINTPSLNVADALEAAALVMRAGYAAYLHGAPGIGKSHAVHQLAKKIGAKCTIVYLADKNAGEAGGLPYLEQGVTVWSLPEYLADIEDNRRPHILFFDELSAAAPDVRIVCYQILQERQLRGYKLPDNVWLIGAGNRVDDGAIAYEMGSALVDRLCHFNVEVDLKTWMNWAEASEIHPDVLSFIKAKPRYLNEEYIDTDYGSGAVVNEENSVVPTPRSWERVSYLLDQVTSEAEYKIVVNRVIPGWLGNMTAYAFSTYLSRMEQLQPIEDYLQATDAELKQMVPDKVDAMYGLTYNIILSADSADDLADRFRIMSVMLSDPGNFRQEMLTVALQLTCTRAERKEWSSELIRNPVWKEFGAPYLKTTTISKRDLA